MVVQKKIRSTAIGVGVTAGVLLGAAIIFKKFNVGSQILDSLKGFGVTAGKGVLAPIEGLVEGVQVGGADLQEQVTGNRDAIGDWWNGVNDWISGSSGGIIPEAAGDSFDWKNILGDIDKVQARPTSARSRTENQTSLSLSNIFSDKSIQDRLTGAIQANTGGRTNSRGTSRDTSKSGYGGYGSADKQETELRKAIEESKKKYSQYFSK